MKKILLIAGLAGLCFASKADLVLSGTLTTPNGAQSGTTNVFLITTNRIVIHNITLSSDKTGFVKLFDSDNTNAPFFGCYYTNDIYWTRLSYPTNYVTTYVGMNGFTNSFTNAGTWTYYSTNAANTNLLPLISSYPFVANTIGNYPADIICARGLCIATSTNVTYSIFYTP